MPANRAGKRMRLQQCLSPGHREPCLSGVPGAGDKARVFSLLCRTGNNEKPLPKLNKLYPRIVLRGKSLMLCLEGDRQQLVFILPYYSKESQTGTFAFFFLCRHPTLFPGFLVGVLGAPRLCKALSCLLLSSADAVGSGERGIWEFIFEKLFQLGAGRLFPALASFRLILSRCVQPPCRGAEVSRIAPGDLGLVSRVGVLSASFF